MKKKYMQPEVEVMLMETQEMIATSTLGYGSDVDDAGLAESREAEEIFNLLDGSPF